jgi:hypothetical protein
VGALCSGALGLGEVLELFIPGISNRTVTAVVSADTDPNTSNNGRSCTGGTSVPTTAPPLAAYNSTISVLKGKSNVFIFSFCF